MSGTPIMDFHNNHSGNSDDGFIIKQGWVYYKDGASRENHLYGPMKPPPEDPFELATLKCQFRVWKLQLAVEEFTVYKKGLITKASPGITNPYPSPPSPVEMEKLSALEKKVLKLKLRVERARAKMESYRTPEAVARSEATEGRAAECMEAVKEIQAIEI